jgi:hypothetical protein
VARNFQYAYSFAGGNFPPVVRKLPVAASQTIVVGDALIMTSGQLVKGGAAIGEVVGIAAEASANAAANTLIEVEIVMPWQVWRAVATADATSVVLNGTETYDLTAAQLVDVADTTGGSLQIIGMDPSSVTSIYVQFMSCFFAGS